jgi:hypothetical protein
MFSLFYFRSHYHNHHLLYLPPYFHSPLIQSFFLLLTYSCLVSFQTNSFMIAYHSLYLETCYLIQMLMLLIVIILTFYFFFSISFTFILVLMYLIFIVIYFLFYVPLTTINHIINKSYLLDN